VTWWDLLAAAAAFLGAVLGVLFARRPPRAIRDLAEGEVHVQSNGVHVVPPGELAAHARPSLLAPGKPHRLDEIAVDCDCRPRREMLRTVEVIVHRSMEGRRR
jgi:hypothetical protein